MIEEERTQNTQFLLKRIDPTQTNLEIRHNLMGEIFEDRKWQRYTIPVIKDKGLLMQVMGLIEKYVNAELRLSIFTKDEVRDQACEFSLELNDLLWFEGDLPVKNKLENINDEEEIDLTNKINPHLIAPTVFSLSTYVYGNLTRAIDGKEGERVNEIVRIVESSTQDNKGFQMPSLGFGRSNKGQQY